MPKRTQGLWEDPVAESLQFEFAHDSLLEQADEIRAGRYLIPGPDLFRNRAAAEHPAPLENQHLLPGAGEISGRDQAIVSAPQ